MGFLKPLAILCLHALIMCVVYKLELLSSFITKIEPYYLKEWDAYWYGSIAEHGYLYDEAKPSNSGFFPLFPYTWRLLWKLTKASVQGVCLFNGMLFLAGMLVLRKAFNFSWMYFLVFISIPSNMFMYVPYTEAIFFFFSTLLLVGLRTNNAYLVAAGLFFASLTKATALFFLPAILCMEILNFESLWQCVKRTAAYAFFPLLGLFSVILFQYKATGVWFAYYRTQAHFWKRTFHVPEFPLTTWGGPRVLWLDGRRFFRFARLLPAGGLFDQEVQGGAQGTTGTGNYFQPGLPGDGRFFGALF